MRRTRRAITLVVSVSLLLAAGTLAAQPMRQHGPGPRDGAPGNFVAEHADELGLSDATRSEIEAIVERTQEKAHKLHRAHRKAAQSLHQLLELDEPDETSVMNQADIVGELELQRRKLRLGAMLEIRSLLTPGQRQQLVEIHEPRRHERRERMRSCRPDAERLCPDSDRPRAVLQCLSEHREELSDECGEALTSLEERLPKGRRH